MPLPQNVPHLAGAKPGKAIYGGKDDHLTNEFMLRKLVYLAEPLSLICRSTFISLYLRKNHLFSVAPSAAGCRCTKPSLTGKQLAWRAPEDAAEQREVSEYVLFAVCFPSGPHAGRRSALVARYKSGRAPTKNVHSK